MSRNRTIFYLVFLAFHVAAFVFTVYLQNVSFLMKMAQHIGTFKFITFLGVVLIVTDIIWTWMASRGARKENTALKHELNTLKAKLFDMQELSRQQEVKQQEAGGNPPDFK